MFKTHLPFCFSLTKIDCLLLTSPSQRNTFYFNRERPLKSTLASTYKVATVCEGGLGETISTDDKQMYTYRLLK